MKPPHDLKCHSAPFQAMARGEKTFEYRKDDRGFEVGDFLRLREWEMTSLSVSDLGGVYTHKCMLVRVTYLLRGPAFGIPLGYVVMSVVRVIDPSGIIRPMKFIAERSAILPALVRAVRASNPKSTMSALGMVQLEAKGGKVRVSATNLELGTTTMLGGPVLTEGHYGVSAKGLLARVLAMPETALTFSVDGSSHGLKVVAPRTSRSYTMHVAPGVDLPAIEAAPAKLRCQLPISFLQRVSAVVPAIAVNAARLHLHCGWLDFKHQHAWATDGHRLHSFGPATSVDNDVVNVPLSALAQLSALIDEVECTVIDVRESRTLIHFSADGASVFSKKVEAHPPAFQHVIPADANCPTQIDIDVAALMTALRSVAIVSSTAALVVDSGRIRIIANQGGDEGDAIDAVPCTVEGPDFQGRIGVAVHYLLDAVRCAGTPRVRIGFRGELDPMKVTAQDYVAVVMPTRL